MKIRQLKAKDIGKLRELILTKYQKGKCALCGKEPIRPCLDHEHKKRLKGTGQIRGVLCSSCNVFVAKSENNCVRYAIGRENLPTILRTMADYIEKKQYPFLHPSEKPKEKKLKKSSFNKVIKEARKRGLPLKKAEYPKSGKVVKWLDHIYKRLGMEPEFYK